MKKLLFIEGLTDQQAESLLQKYLNRHFEHPYLQEIRLLHLQQHPNLHCIEMNDSPIPLKDFLIFFIALRDLQIKIPQTYQLRAYWHVPHTKPNYRLIEHKELMLFAPSEDLSYNIVHAVTPEHQAYELSYDSFNDLSMTHETVKYIPHPEVDAAQNTLVLLHPEWQIALQNKNKQRAQRKIVAAVLSLILLILFSLISR